MRSIKGFATLRNFVNLQFVAEVRAEVVRDTSRSARVSEDSQLISQQQHRSARFRSVLFSKQLKWTIIIYLFKIHKMCKKGYLIQKWLFT